MFVKQRVSLTKYVTQNNFSISKKKVKRPLLSIKRETNCSRSVLCKQKQIKTHLITMSGRGKGGKGLGKGGAKRHKKSSLY